MLEIRFSRLVLAWCIACLVAGAAAAHDQRIAMDGDSVEVAFGGAASRFHFAGSGPGIGVVHDPRIGGGFAFLVHGVGPGTGRSELVTLDPTRWSFDPADDSYSYLDPSAARQGVYLARYASGEIQIHALEGWDWAPTATVEALRVQVRADDQWLCADFPDGPGGAVIQWNLPGLFRATNGPPSACPPQVCGNGQLEDGEECDDGNLDGGDGCENDCRVGECFGDDFASTFDAIQTVVIEGYGCAIEGCHSTSPTHPLAEGRLDLTPAAAREALLGPDGQGAPSTGSLVPRVTPTEPARSFLYEKLAAATLKTPLIGGTPMPVGGALSEKHLEAVRLWIRGGAPSDLVVEGTSALLGSCLPEPDPLIVATPDPPAGGSGLQLRQTARPLPRKSESEVCMMTWYDFTQTSLIPAEARIPCPERYAPTGHCSLDENTECSKDDDCPGGSSCALEVGVNNPEGECFAYKKTTIIQDPQSHHEVILAYTGASTPESPIWGDWSYKFRPEDDLEGKQGQPCDARAVDPSLGFNPGCSSEAIESVACVDYGPADFGEPGTVFGGGGTTPQILITQEPYSEFAFAEGAYDFLPMKGMIVWNSHAFNFTKGDSTMSSFMNLDFAIEGEREWPIVKYFYFNSIFAMSVPPFETREYCRTFTYPQHARLFRLSSHMHQRGVLFQIWEPPNEPCRSGCEADGNPICPILDRLDEGPKPICEGPRGGTGEGAEEDDDPPFYYSTDYADPLEWIFDPPEALDSADPAWRSYLFCAAYDNHATPDSPPLKRQSTSIDPPPGIGALVGGGPCANEVLECANEGKRHVVCGGDHSLCNNTGQQDGDCDACPVVGGVTTDDEMFAIFTDYFVAAPEPAARGLAACALATLALLSRPRRRGR